jgi:hypothetical protein
MTIALYAGTEWPLDAVTVRLRHSDLRRGLRVVQTNEGKLDRIERDVNSLARSARSSAPAC